MGGVAYSKAQVEENVEFWAPPRPARPRVRRVSFMGVEELALLSVEWFLTPYCSKSDIACPDRQLQERGVVNS